MKESPMFTSSRHRTAIAAGAVTVALALPGSAFAATGSSPRAATAATSAHIAKKKTSTKVTTHSS